MPVRRWSAAKIGDLTLNAVAGALHVVKKVYRPASGGTPAFELAYVRTGPITDTPTVVIPGGPGLASVLPYRKLRRQAARDGLDIIMVEHRGVGLSRADLTGTDLPISSMWVKDVVDDIAAVLDNENVRKAFIAGSSYGSYLASTFAVKHPQRVAGMLLDSALQSAQDLHIERRRIRDLFWHSTGALSELIHGMVELGGDQRLLLDVVRAGYELSGSVLVERMLRRRLAGRISLVWNLLASYSRRDASIVGIPGYYEFARAGAIGFRELDYGAKPDNQPLDPALTYSLLAPVFPPFSGEPYDLLAATPSFDWPVVLLVGDRDIRTPPEIALRTAALAQDSIVVQINNGHSALDTHMLAFEKTLVALVRGYERRLPLMATELSGLPRRGAGADLQKVIEAMSGIR